MRFGHFILFSILAATGCGGDVPRTSVLLITVDTLRADALGSDGNARARTPRMDRLAAEGVRFSQAKAVCPLTLPSHATILTGLLPPEHDLRDNDPPRPLAPPELRGFRTLAEVLSDAGYDTAAFVSASVLSRRTGLDAGFAVYDGPEEGEPGALRYAERRGGETVAMAGDWLADADEPFFLWVHLFDPHSPYEAPVAFRSPSAEPGSREAYADEVAYTDRCVGQILDALDRRSGAERTLTVLTSDHGEGLGEHGEQTHGYLLFDTTLRVPLIVRWPGHVPEGQARDDVVSLAHIGDVVLAATGILGGPKGSILDGPGDRIALAETLYGWRHMGWAQLLAAQRRNVKLIQGAVDEVYDLHADRSESRPGRNAVPDLQGELSRYRALSSRTGGEGQPLEPMTGLPYLSGLGRGRLSFLDPEENRRLRAPDPELAREIDRLKARVGTVDPEPVRRALLALEARDPDNPSISFWLGRNAEASGDSEAASRAFARAFDKGLREAKVVYLWLKHLLNSGDLPGARRVIEEQVPMVVPDCATYLLIGAYHLSTENPAEAARMANLAERFARTSAERDLLSRFRHKLGSGNEK